MKNHENLYAAGGLCTAFFGIMFAIIGTNLYWYCACGCLFALSAVLWLFALDQYAKRSKGIQLKRAKTEKEVIKLLSEIKGAVLADPIVDRLASIEERNRQTKETIAACMEELSRLVSQGMEEAKRRQEENTAQYEQMKETVSLGQRKLADALADYAKTAQSTAERAIHLLGECGNTEKEIQAECKGSRTELVQIKSNLSAIHEIPDEILKAWDEVVKKATENLENQKELMRDFSESVERSHAKSIKEIRDDIQALCESFDGYGEGQNEAMQLLMEQYKEFEKVTDSLIEKLTLMSSEDIHMLRDLLCGDSE